MKRLMIAITFVLLLTSLTGFSQTKNPTVPAPPKLAPPPPPMPPPPLVHIKMMEKQPKHLHQFKPDRMPVEPGVPVDPPLPPPPPPPPIEEFT